MYLSLLPPSLYITPVAKYRLSQGYAILSMTEQYHQAHFQKLRGKLLFDAMVTSTLMYNAAT